MKVSRRTGIEIVGSSTLTPVKVILIRHIAPAAQTSFERAMAVAHARTIFVQKRVAKIIDGHIASIRTLRTVDVFGHTFETDLEIGKRNRPG